MGDSDSIVDRSPFTCVSSSFTRALSPSSPDAGVCYEILVRGLTDFEEESLLANVREQKYGNLKSRENASRVELFSGFF